MHIVSRLGRECSYAINNGSFASSSTSQSPGSELFPPSDLSAFRQLKRGVISFIQSSSPKAVIPTYERTIEPWFPIAFDLRDSIRSTWDETQLDVALLCLSIKLLSTDPMSTAKDNAEDHIEPKAVYLHIKSSIALTEGLGLNSFPLVHTRIMITLYEVCHGFYAAAYISIASTFRSMDALLEHPPDTTKEYHRTPVSSSHEEAVSAWCAILLLDR